MYLTSIRFLRPTRQTNPLVSLPCDRGKANVDQTKPEQMINHQDTWGQTKHTADRKRLKQG